MSRMQSTLVAGDTLNFRVAVQGRPAGEGWTLRYRLVPRATGATAIEIVATPEDGDTYLVRAVATITAAWAPGEYGFAAWVANAIGEVYTVETGQLTILPNPRTATVATDSRSLPRRTLDDLIVARAAWATTQGRTRRYRIGDREREFVDAAELDREIRYWEGQVAAEEQAGRLASGLKPRNRILTRFVRPR